MKRTKESVIKELEELGFKSTPNNFARLVDGPMYFNVDIPNITFYSNGKFWKLKYEERCKDFSYWCSDRVEWRKINGDLDIASIVVLYGK